MTRTFQAYLDPGSSSMILQMLLGGVAAIGVALKLYWRRLMRLLGIRKEDKPVAEPAAARTTEAAASATVERETVETTKP